MNKALQALKNKGKKKSTKPITYEKFADMLKEGQNLKALRALLKKSDQQTRVLYVLNLINNSGFKAYPQAMKKFNTVINIYLKNGDATVLNQYKKELETALNSPEANFTIFAQLRELLLKDLLHNSPESLFNLLMTLMMVENRDYEFQYEENRAKELAANLACQVWPAKAKGLKVLYGS